MPSMMHLMPFTCHVFITAAAIFMQFFHPRPVMVDIVRYLPPESMVLCTRAARLLCVYDSVKLAWPGLEWCGLNG